MTQISLKLPPEDLEFLEWYTKKTSTPKASLYRDITLETFREWKQNFLLKEYINGDVTIKEFCKLANISMFKAMSLIENTTLEPNIPDIIDEYSTKMTEYNIKTQDASIFKNKISIKRESPNINFKNN